MENFQQDVIKTLETVANGFGQLFQDISKDMGEAADALLEFTEEMAEEVERAIAPGLDQLDDQITEWIEPLLQALTGLESTLDQATEPMTHTVEPLLNQHPICVGCRHYHGQAYNGTMLVCAMHPYGIVDGSESCPDKELVSWSIPSIKFSDFPDDDF
jgi:hypothetical protein